MMNNSDNNSFIISNDNYVDNIIGSNSNSNKKNTEASSSKNNQLFFHTMKDETMVERVRVVIKDAHVFKLPVRKCVSIGYRGAEWNEKVWQGTIKVVERGEHCAVMLVDKNDGSTFAVCPYREGAVERCVDSSRYFVLRIENEKGKHMFIGVAFNERNDAFDFNTTLEDSKREKEQERKPFVPYTGPTKDYSIKKGQKIKVSIPKKNKDEYSDDKNTTQTDCDDYSDEDDNININIKNKIKHINNRESPKSKTNIKISGDVPPPADSFSYVSKFLPSFLTTTAFDETNSTPTKKQNSSATTVAARFLAPPSKDTPSRTVPISSSSIANTTTSAKKTAALSKLSLSACSSNKKTNQFFSDDFATSSFPSEIKSKDSSANPFFP